MPTSVVTAILLLATTFMHAMLNIAGTVVVAGATAFGGRARRGERRAARVDIHPVFVAFGEENSCLVRVGALQDLASKPSHWDLTSYT
jgi:hypothetical protein